jgi:hypothetical protein
MRGKGEDVKAVYFLAAEATVAHGAVARGGGAARSNFCSCCCRQEEDSKNVLRSSCVHKEITYFEADTLS